MRFMARLTLASLGLALATPLSVMAADVPASRSAAASTSIPAHKHKHSLFGKQHCPQCEAKAAKAKADHDAKVAAVTDRSTVTAASTETASPRHCPHMLNGVCLECSSKLSYIAPEQPVSSRNDLAKINRVAVPDSLAGGQVVSCAHQKSGVCRECKAFLEMPGKVSVVSQTKPGRAVATDNAPGHAVVQAGEPEPIGVMRTNYNVPTPAQAVSAPGRAVVNAGAPAPAVPSGPYMPAKVEGSPHILGHLFGISEMGNDFHDWWTKKDRQKKDAHAAIPYGPNTGSVEDLPASMVYGKSDAH